MGCINQEVRPLHVTCALDRVQIQKWRWSRAVPILVFILAASCAALLLRRMKHKNILVSPYNYCSLRIKCPDRVGKVKSPNFGHALIPVTIATKLFFSQTWRLQHQVLLVGVVPTLDYYYINL